MVADVEKLSETIRRNTWENDLRNIIQAQKSDIEKTLQSGKSYFLRVPDGRVIRISKMINI